MRTNVGALIVIAVLAGCASLSGARTTPNPSPLALISGSAMGTHGVVRFATADVGWIVAAQTRLGRTVVYRTGDGGATWALWGSVQGMAYPTAVNASEVVLLASPLEGKYQSVVRSSDGMTWDTLALAPPSREVTFLADLQIGWIVELGSDSVVYRTLDGGHRWINTGRHHEEMEAYTPQFWDSESGFSSAYENCAPNGSSDPCDNNFRYTFDAGATWSPIQLALTDGQKHAGFVRPRMPTMLDGSHGLMPITFGPEVQFLRDKVYVSQTSDRGRRWSTPRPVRLPDAGEMADLQFLDLAHWVYAGTEIGGHAFVTADGGATWSSASGVATGTAAGSNGYYARKMTVGTDRHLVFLTTTAEDIEWLEISSDWGAHWRPVVLPDLREAAWKGL